MKENVTAVTDERMVHYGIAFRNSLELVKGIKRNMQEGKRTICLTIADKITNRSIDLEIGNDLLGIAQGAAFGAYRELVYVRIFVERTGEKMTAINPDGKAIADGLIKDMSRQDTSFESELEGLLLRVEDPRV